MGDWFDGKWLAVTGHAGMGIGAAFVAGGSFVEVQHALRIKHLRADGRLK